MKNPKRLKRKYKLFLKNLGCNPDDFLIVGEYLEYYKFYNKVTRVPFDLRR
ncbi:hypothetical protein [Clostridium sp. DL-VIII]|uniref:DUF6906 family protein n=1 Tax=Clostridium sp. DL-VIII TaxID=641107 RepID=UPI00031B208C|nr:hypothetical protein [Clostridium sp. DL-VIII]